MSDQYPVRNAQTLGPRELETEVLERIDRIVARRNVALVKLRWGGRRRYATLSAVPVPKQAPVALGPLHIAEFRRAQAALQPVLKGPRLGGDFLGKVVRRAVGETLGRLDRTVVQGLDPSVVALLGPMNGIVERMRHKASERNIEILVELILPDHDPMRAARSRIEAANAAARARFLDTVPCLDNDALAQFAGHAARNASATGSRWKAERKAFAVSFKRKDLFPAFQFADGRPLPVVGRILHSLPSGMSPWQTAFWFVSSNPWLDGRVPAEHLADADAVIEAARREGGAGLG